MSTINPNYATAAAITITLTSLATDSNLLAGRESTVIPNGTNKYDDAILRGKIKTGTTTANTSIEIWIYSNAIEGVSYSAGATGSDAALSLANVGVKRLMKRALVIDVSDTTSRTYYFGGLSIAAIFGGIMPKDWGVFIVHNTGAALDATGSNHAIEYQGITYTNA